MFTKPITKKYLLMHFYYHESRDVRFLANVISTGCRNPFRKLLGLYKLLERGHLVTTVQFDSMSFKLDGIKNYPMSELENIQ